MVRRHPRPTYVSKELDEIQGDGKHSHLERRHYRELRACRRSFDRKGVNFRLPPPRFATTGRKRGPPAGVGEE